MANRSFYTLCSTHNPRIDDQSVITARNTVINKGTFSHQIDTIIAELLHLFRHSDIGRRNHKRPAGLCNLCMMLIQSCLNGSKRGIGILRGREVIVKDHPTLKEPHQVWYESKIFPPHLLPCQSIHQKIQHDLSSVRGMMEHNGCPHSKRHIGLNLHGLLNTIERKLPSAQDHGVLAIGLQEVYSLFFLFCGNRNEKWFPSLS